MLAKIAHLVTDHIDIDLRGGSLRGTIEDSHAVQPSWRDKQFISVPRRFRNTVCQGGLPESLARAGIENHHPLLEFVIRETQRGRDNPRLSVPHFAVAARAHWSVYRPQRLAGSRV